MAGICKTFEIKKNFPPIWEGHCTITEQEILMVNQITPNVAEKHVTSIATETSTENKYTHQQYLQSLSVILTTHNNPGTGSLFLLIPSGRW